MPTSFITTGTSAHSEDIVFQIVECKNQTGKHTSQQRACCQQCAHYVGGTWMAATLLPYEKMRWLPWASLPTVRTEPNASRSSSP